jgi:hypothetical protein
MNSSNSRRSACLGRCVVRVLLVVAALLLVLARLGVGLVAEIRVVQLMGTVLVVVAL